MTGDARLSAPAAARNRQPILDALKPHLPPRGLVLEVAGGTGEHVVHFAQACPAVIFQPSDPDPQHRASTDAWSAALDLANVRPAIALDVTAEVWPVEAADALVCINMIHIAPWTAAEGLMRGAGRVLPPGGLLYLYGPYLRENVETAPSNLAFDASLKARDPQWGLRRVEDVIAAATHEGLVFRRLLEMPANNLSLIFRRRD